MQQIIQNIEDYIEEFADPSVLEKGKRIAKTIDNFGTPDIDLEKAEATFRIMGTYFYTVSINNFFTDVDSFCTCPYEWGDICKHEVGALLYLAEYLKKSGLKMPIPNKKLKLNHSAIPKERRASQPYMLNDYRQLNYEWLHNNTGFYQLNQAYQYKINKFELQGSSVIFNANTASYYWNKKSGEFQIRFTRTNTGLEVVCSCDSIVEKLCTHQVSSLIHIMEKLGNDFFEVLDPEYLQKRAQQMAESTGIPLELLDSYYKFDTKTRKFLPKTNALGLINFNDPKVEKSNNLVFAPLQTQNFSIPEPILDNEKALEMGYVFSFEDPLQLSLIPITGTPSDTPWLKYIKNYSPKNQALRMDATDEELLAIIAELEKMAEANFKNSYSIQNQEDVDVLKFYYKKLKRLFVLLTTKTQVYIRLSRHTGAIKKSHIEPVTLSNDPIELFFELGEEDIFYYLKAKLKLGKQEIDLSDPSIAISELCPFFSLVLWKDCLYLQPSLNQASTLFQFRQQSPIFKVIKKDFALFFEKVVHPIAQNHPIETQIMEDFVQKEIKLQPQERQLYISELSNFIIFKPVVKYDNEQSVNARVLNSLVEMQDKSIITYKRDEEYERDFTGFLTSLHPEFEKQKFGEFYFLAFSEVKRDNWFFYVFEKIIEQEISVFGINDLKTIKYSPFKAQINTHIKSGLDWFDVEIKLSFGEENVKLTDLRKAVLRNERFIELSNGKIGLLPEEWFQKMQRFFRIGELQKGELKISKLKFSVIDELFDEIDDIEVIKELQEKKRKLQSFQSIKEIEIPEKITAQLRGYQKEGYNWLNFLDEFRWGGILADDMGLGKTLQILTFLQRQSNQCNKTNLVVVPTSLLFNWENEIHKFAPALQYRIHHGTDRTNNPDDFSHCNVLITTYGLISNDIELFQKCIFNYIILDESQAIKNPSSKRYKAACLLQGRNKIAMTGTPIENNTFDLYAQLNFLNPGFLGSQQAFKKEFSKPIDGEGNAERATELQKLVRPFILRRTKEQVAQELPPKVEDYIYCTMDTEQRKLYDAFRNKYRNYLLEKIEEEGIQRSKLYVLEGLLKLRQICDSPELLRDEENYGKESIKIKELLKHITEKTGKHKILVFSQFVRMLKLIERELQKKKIKYEYLDGQCSPKARMNSVKTFQEEEDYRVFLISLKAGGTGLNLTAADYVYIVDPWWNPAVENQAIDRTHRIGQDKHIIAYRMICKNTVEEKILKLQQKKMRIASDIIHTDESFMKNLSKDDVMELFTE